MQTWDMSVSKLWEIVKDRGVWCAAVHGVAKLDTTQELNNNKTWERLRKTEQNGHKNGQSLHLEYGV